MNLMTTGEWAVFGLGMGLRHALDPDHLAAITTMLDREASAMRAMRLAAMWGLGHGTSFVAVGLPIVLLDLHVPDRFESVASLLVAALLVGLGVFRLFGSTERTGADSTRARDARPLAVGIAHGTAGSAGVALLAAATLDSRVAAGGTLAMVALGTLVGMVLATLVLAKPLAWTASHEGLPRTFARIAPAILSITLGGAIGRDAVVAFLR